MSNPLIDAESLSLTVTLAGRPYPLRVLPSDEEPIRRIAKELNDKVVDLQRTYPGKDKQDCLAMSLLLYAVDLYKVKDAQTATPDARSAPILQRLERQLTEALAGPTGGPPTHPREDDPSAAVADEGAADDDDDDAGLLPL